MPSRTILYALGAAALALLIWWSVAKGMSAYHERLGARQEAISHQHDQEAQSHAQAAQAIPDHAAAIQAAEARVKASEAKAGRLQRERDALLARLAAQPPAIPDIRDEVIAKDKEVIQSQAEQIVGQAGQIAVLGLALKDEQHRSNEFQAAFQHEQQARLAQEAATNAWKQAVKESRWRGRIEGFAAGAVLGYVGGKL